MQSEEKFKQEPKTFFIFIREARQCLSSVFRFLSPKKTSMIAYDDQDLSQTRCKPGVFSKTRSSASCTTSSLPCTVGQFFDVFLQRLSLATFFCVLSFALLSQTGGGICSASCLTF